MTFARVNAGKGTMTDTGASANSNSVTTASLTVGNRIFVIVTYATGWITTTPTTSKLTTNPSDGHNTYTFWKTAVSAADAGGGGFYFSFAEIWSAPITTGGVQTITAGITGGTTDNVLGLSYLEYSGLDLSAGTGSMDASGAGSFGPGASTTGTVTSSATTAANQLVLSAPSDLSDSNDLFTWNSGTPTETKIAAASFDSTNLTNGAVGEGTLASGTTASANWTVSGPDTGSLVIVVAKLGAGGTSHPQTTAASVTSTASVTIRKTRALKVTATSTSTGAITANKITAGVSHPLTVTAPVASTSALTSHTIHRLTVTATVTSTRTLAAGRVRLLTVAATVTSVAGINTLDTVNTTGASVVSTATVTALKVLGGHPVTVRANAVSAVGVSLVATDHTSGVSVSSTALVRTAVLRRLTVRATVTSTGAVTALRQIVGGTSHPLTVTASVTSAADLSLDIYMYRPMAAARSSSTVASAPAIHVQNVGARASVTSVADLSMDIFLHRPQVQVTSSSLTSAVPLGVGVFSNLSRAVVSTTASVSAVFKGTRLASTRANVVAAASVSTVFIPAHTTLVPTRAAVTSTASVTAVPIRLVINPLHPRANVVSTVSVLTVVIPSGTRSVPSRAQVTSTVSVSTVVIPVVIKTVQVHTQVVSSASVSMRLMPFKGIELQSFVISTVTVQMNLLHSIPQKLIPITFNDLVRAGATLYPYPAMDATSD